MTTTGQDLIDRTIDGLYSGERDEFFQLSSDIAPADTEAEMTDAFGESLRKGVVVSCGIEQMLVTEVQLASKKLVLKRAYRGSPPMAHVDGSIVWVNPRFSEWRVWRAVQDEIQDLSSPEHGLFKIVTANISRNSDSVYAFAPVDLTDIFDIRNESTSMPYAHAPIWHYDYTGSFIRVFQDPAPDSIVVRYKAPFVLTATPDVDIATTGLDPAAYDIPVLGAQMRLMGTREVKRAFTEAQGDARRAEEVPMGASITAFRPLVTLREQRISAERARLIAKLGLPGA